MSIPVLLCSGQVLVDRPARLAALAAAATGGRKRKRPHTGHQEQEGGQEHRDCSSIVRLRDAYDKSVDLVDVYRRRQLTVLRFETAGVREQCGHVSLQALDGLAKSHPLTFAAHFHVENDARPQPVVDEEGPLGTARVLGEARRTTQDDGTSYYASFILQNNATLLSELFALMPFPSPPCFTDGDSVRHDDGVWLFVGHHNPPSRISRKPPPLAGRPEHTDRVEHDGTWHLQISGTKTWHLRPKLDADEWRGAGHDRPEPCRITVAAGDVLVVNTRIWYHRTEIEAQVGPSISIARDFFFLDEASCADAGDGGDETGTDAVDDGGDGGDGGDDDSTAEGGKLNACEGLDDRLFARDDVLAGDPAIDPTACLPTCILRSLRPNCELALAHRGGGGGGGGGGGDSSSSSSSSSKYDAISGELQVVLFASVDIKAGTLLTVPLSKEDHDRGFEVGELDPLTGAIKAVPAKASSKESKTLASKKSKQSKHRAKKGKTKRKTS